MDTFTGLLHVLAETVGGIAANAAANEDQERGDEEKNRKVFG